MPANLIMLPFTLHLHEQVALGCSKRIQMTQNVFPQTNWALKSTVMIWSAIRFDDFFRISPSSNSTIPRSILVWQVFLDATRTYFSIALRLACSLSLDLLLFALGECEFRVYTIYILEDGHGIEGPCMASKTGLRPGKMLPKSPGRPKKLSFPRTLKTLHSSSKCVLKFSCSRIIRLLP